MLTYISYDIIEYVEYIEYIEMFINPEQVIESQGKPICLDNKKQLVSKTDMADEYLQSCLYRTFIFQTYFPPSHSFQTA